MSTIEVTDASDERWAVGVPLLPWSPRLRWRGRETADADIGTAIDTADSISSVGDVATGFLDLDWLDELAVIGIAIALAVGLFVLAGWLLPLAVLAVEVVVVVLACGALAFARTLFRTPWTVRVERPDGRVVDYRTVGYRRARRAARYLAARVRTNHPLPDAGDLDPDRMA